MLSITCTSNENWDELGKLAPIIVWDADWRMPFGLHYSLKPQGCCCVTENINNYTLMTLRSSAAVYAKKNDKN